MVPIKNTSGQQKKAIIFSDEMMKNQFLHAAFLSIEHPEVPMDNNPGEKSIRNPVTGRKNFYGSGSKWSSELAAIMFSIFQTLGLWEINRNHWLRAYLYCATIILTACAENHGNAHEDLSVFLPWEMDKGRIQNLSRPPDTL